jgi:hypothetical protein
MWIFATAVFLVLVFFLYRHTKTTLNVIGVVLALIVGAIAFTAYYNDSTSQSTYVDRDSQVKVSVSYNATACGAGFPLRTTISNFADKAINSISWTLAAYVPGRSSDITKFTSYSSDYILEPKREITLCYKAPELTEAHEPSTLRWEVQLPVISFRN